MPIFVDLVPTFNLDQRKLIAKASRHNNQLLQYTTQPIFQESIVENERAMMNNLPVPIKTGLVIAKAVRTTSICHAIDLNALAVSTPIDLIDVSTSYMLKNIAFELEPEERPEYHGSDTSSESDNEMTLNPIQPTTTLASGYASSCEIYRELKRSVKKGRVSSALDDSTIFHCQHAEKGTIEAACCLKRRVILAVCDEILTWLEQHKNDFEQMKEEMTLMNAITYPRK